MRNDIRNPLSRGYQDGLAGRNSAHDHPEYQEGWEMGWRERMHAWNSMSQPAGIIDARPLQSNF